MDEYRFWFSKRFLVGVLAFLGEMNIFTMRGNLNIAIIQMTSNHTEIEGNTTVITKPEFSWSPETVNYVLSLYVYGAVLAPIGGYLAMRFGGSTIITISCLFASLLTLLNPIVLRYSFFLFVITRLVEGITECFRFVSFPELWMQWSPIQDRSKLMAITLSGLYAAPALVYPIFGYLTLHYGWPSTFYYTGAFSLLWTAVWFVLVPNRPESDRWISKKELEYIRRGPQQSKPKNLRSMWKNMILSGPVWALGIARVVQDFGLVVTVTYLPMYIKDLTGSEIDRVGIYSAIPTIINLFTIPCVGYLIDYFRNNEYLTTSQALKLFACGGFALGGITLMTIPFWSYNFVLIMICMSLLKTAVSVIWIVCNLGILAMAPGCSSALASILSLFHMLGSSIAPIIITQVVTDHKLWQWNICFYIFGIFSFMAGATFFAFGSGKPQPWSYSIANKNITDDGIEEDKHLT